MQVNLATTQAFSAAMETTKFTVLETRLCELSLATKKNRKVRFASTIAIYYSSIWDDQFELSDLKRHLWWSREDFRSFMSRAVRTSTEARKHTLLLEALDKAKSYSRQVAQLLGDQESLNKNLENMRDEDRGLRLWCQYGHSRRGLEKYTSRLCFKTKRSDRLKLLMQVTMLSRTGVEPELIRQVSERTCRSSAIFARMLGIADAQAARSQSLCLESHQTLDSKSAMPKTAKRSDTLGQSRNVSKGKNLESETVR
jgi:hypothetical protein